MDDDKVKENNLEKIKLDEKYNSEILNYYDTNLSNNTNILYIETDCYNMTMVFTKKKNNIQII